MKPQTRLTAFLLLSCWLIGLAGMMLTDGLLNTVFLLMSSIPVTGAASVYILRCNAAAR